MLHEKLAVHLDAAEHGVDGVVHVDETTARAWVESRVRTVPRFAVLMDEMAATANESARRQGLRHHAVRGDLLRIRHHAIRGEQHDLVRLLRVQRHAVRTVGKGSARP